jgi:hypothetical protein
MLTIIRPTLLFLPILAHAQYIPQSVLLSPGEATAVKSWGLLKGSVNDIGDEVMKMMEVRTDIQAMQDDLKTQEELWKQGELQLKQEKAKLQADVAKLKEQVRTGEVVRTNVLNLTHGLASEKAYMVDQQEQYHAEQADWAKARIAHQGRKHDLMIQLQDVEQQILEEDHKNEVKHNELMADQAGLRMKADQLMSKLMDMKVQEKAMGSKDQLEVDELTRQQTQMKSGLEVLTGHLATPTHLDQRLKSLQAQLAEETHKLLALQQAHNNEAMACNQKLRELQQVLQAEQGKEQARHHEMLSLCQPVEAQQALLRQQLAACQQPA